MNGSLGRPLGHWLSTSGSASQKLDHPLGDSLVGAGCLVTDSPSFSLLDFDQNPSFTPTKPFFNRLLAVRLYGIVIKQTMSHDGLSNRKP